MSPFHHPAMFALVAFASGAAAQTASQTPLCPYARCALRIEALPASMNGVQLVQGIEGRRVETSGVLVTRIPLWRPARTAFARRTMRFAHTTAPRMESLSSRSVRRWRRRSGSSSIAPAAPISSRHWVLTSASAWPASSRQNWPGTRSRRQSVVTTRPCRIANRIRRRVECIRQCDHTSRVSARIRYLLLAADELRPLSDPRSDVGCNRGVVAAVAPRERASCIGESMKPVTQIGVHVHRR